MCISKQNKVINFCVVTGILFLLPPLLFTLWYIDKVSLYKTVPFGNIGEFLGVTERLESKVIPAASSTAQYPFQVFQTDLNFKDFDEVGDWLRLFNIPTDFIRHSVYLVNNVRIQLNYRRENSTQQETSYFSSTVPCDGQLVVAGHEFNKNVYLLKSNLNLYDTEKNNRSYIDNVIKECLWSGNFSVQNDLGYPVTVTERGAKLSYDSSITLIAEPNAWSKFFVYIGFVIFWVGFLILFREGPYKFYKYLETETL